MTEKEFLDGFRSRGLGHWDMQAARLGLALAREALADAGAKFDPEPVEMPVLSMRYANLDGHPVYYPVTAAGIPSQREATEIVRRCNAWPKLRKLWESYRDGWEEPVSYEAAAANEAAAASITAILKGRE